MICTKCGREINESNSYDFDAGQGKYGSKLDGCLIVFKLCDDCTNNMVESFIHKGTIINSGINDIGYQLYGEALQEALNSEGGNDVY